MDTLLNEPKKQYATDMHTTEHILNQTMVRLFKCERSHNAHIERKKSKCDYFLTQPPTSEEINIIENKVNEVIRQNLPVTIEFTDKKEAQKRYNLNKLPLDASETLRIVKIGEYDSCPCIGMHVENTSEIGQFKIISHDYKEGVWRVRFKLIN